MRLRDLASACALVLAVTLSPPALARGHKDRPYRDGPDMRPDWKGDRAPAYGPEFGRIRADWLMQCRGRIADRGGAGLGDGLGTGQALPGAPDACETALDNYYTADGTGYGSGTIMVPVVIPGKPCVETLTTDPGPARRVIPRPAPRPAKRIYRAPDKRIPIK